MQIETGVMVIKNGKGWGIIYEDGRETVYGWMPLEKAPIHNPNYVKKVQDVSYRKDKELLTGKLMYVERRTEVFIK